MTQATDLADATASSDPEVGLAAVASLRALLESLEALQVDNARERGWSWQQIAGRPRCEQAGGPQEARRRAATARAEGAVMFERFSKSAREVVVRAQAEGRTLGHERIGTADLRSASPPATAARRTCSPSTAPRTRPCAPKRPARPSTARRWPRSASTSTRSGAGPRPPSGRARSSAAAALAPATCRSRREAKKSLELALREAIAAGDREIGAEHVLLGLLREGGASALLQGAGAGPRRGAAGAQPGGRVVADAEGDLLVRAGGERLLAGAVGIGLGRQRAARAQPREHQPEPEHDQQQRPPQQRVVGRRSPRRR